jgi:enoyl-CoA hydratase
LGAIRIDTDRGMAVVRLDKGRGNAIDPALVRELAEAARRLEGDAGVRGVLLTSAHPKVFCPGLDLVTLIDFDREAMEHFMLQFADMVAVLYGMAKPMVVGVNGHAVAGGCILALTGDYRVLRRGGAQIGLNEVKVGVPLPWSVTVLLRATVPPQALAEVALLGRNFADDDALKAGLADQLADADGFEDFCRARLEEFVEKDAQAVRVTKSYLRRAHLAEMQAGEAARIGEWLDGWFSEPTRARLHETVAALTRRA